ncbi:MAG TPA: DsbA family oxidoreductase [Chitinophagaceae bacterium]|nr:DsbA family oxidoreductase [Chitinophagaceae bacterium]
MKIEIWSDIMCPFCYIGKRRLESALEQFPHAKDIELEWHSFQLDPAIEAGHGKNLYQYLSERKGIPYQQAVSMHVQLTQTAKEAGLTYNFDDAKVANSYDAHRLIQLAKTQGLGDAAEERLFRAYFTEGRDFSDHDTLVALGKEIGLDEAAVNAMLDSNAYSEEVNRDIAEAETIGIRGVPFFVFDRKYAVSGAQPAATFLGALNTSFTEWQKEQPGPVTAINEGEVCTPDGDCK